MRLTYPALIGNDPGVRLTYPALIGNDPGVRPTYPALIGNGPGVMRERELSKAVEPKCCGDDDVGLRVLGCRVDTLGTKL